jgi:hypothetical protein
MLRPVPDKARPGHADQIKTAGDTDHIRSANTRSQAEFSLKKNLTAPLSGLGHGAGGNAENTQQRQLFLEILFHGSSLDFLISFSPYLAFYDIPLINTLISTCRWKDASL